MSSRLESFRAPSGVPGVGAFFEERLEPTVNEAVGKLNIFLGQNARRSFFLLKNIGFWYLT